MENLLQTETVIIELLLVVSLVAIAIQRIRLPYTVALVLVGLALTFQGAIRFELTEELILALFLPPLLLRRPSTSSFRSCGSGYCPFLLWLFLALS